MLLNAAREAHVNPDDYLIGQTAVCLAIEQHEAFKQEVSDAITALLDRFLGDGLSQGVINGHLHRFIISADVPDALVDVWGDLFVKNYNLKQFCAALDAAGFEIREKNDD